MSDTLKKIAENLGVTTINGNYLSGIADYYGVDLATSTDIMADILTASGGYPESSTDYLQDIVLILGGTEPVNGNWMEAWEAITAVPPVLVPVNTVPPALNYVYRYEGETVTTDDGTWDNSPTSFTYQWYRDATPISGETLNQYSLAAADVDTYVSCEVTAINGSGSSTPAPSDAIYVFDYDYGQVYYYYEDTDEAKSILQNQFMIAIKAAGVWAKLDVLCVFRGSGAGNALVDWKRYSEVTLMGTVNFNASEGFTIGGASYIDTAFDPYNMGINYQQDNASRYFFPYQISGGPMDGTSTLRNSMTAGGNPIDNYINQSLVPLAIPFVYTTTAEPKSIHRTSATDIKLYNGTTASNRIALSTYVESENQLIGSADGVIGEHIVSGYAMGASMVSENTDFVAAWNTYITAL